MIGTASAILASATKQPTKEVTMTDSTICTDAAMVPGIDSTICDHCGLEVEPHESGLCDSCETQDAFDRASSDYLIPINANEMTRSSVTYCGHWLKTLAARYLYSRNLDDVTCAKCARAVCPYCAPDELCALHQS